MQAPAASTLVTIALVPLLAWRMHSRFRKLVGRQRLSPVRPWITLVLYGLILSLLGWFALRAGVMPWGLPLGLLVGGALSIHGLRVTTFEPTPQGIYYTPHTGLGIALSLLFVGRIAYRVYEVYVAGSHPEFAGADFFHSIWTLLLFGFLAGYYMGYAIGLLRYRFRRLKMRAERLAAQSAESE